MSNTSTTSKFSSISLLNGEVVNPTRIELNECPFCESHVTLEKGKYKQQDVYMQRCARDMCSRPLDVPFAYIIVNEHKQKTKTQTKKKKVTKKD